MRFPPPSARFPPECNASALQRRRPDESAANSHYGLHVLLIGDGAALQGCVRRLRRRFAEQWLSHPSAARRPPPTPVPSRGVGNHWISSPCLSQAGRRLSTADPQGSAMSASRHRIPTPRGAIGAHAPPSTSPGARIERRRPARGPSHLLSELRRARRAAMSCACPARIRRLRGELVASMKSTSRTWPSTRRWHRHRSHPLPRRASPCGTARGATVSR